MFAATLKLIRGGHIRALVHGAGDGDVFAHLEVVGKHGHVGDVILAGALGADGPVVNEAYELAAVLAHPEERGVSRELWV